jgi:hypothetical protein
MQALWVEARYSRLAFNAWGHLIGVRSTLILSIEGEKGIGGLPHTGLPEIVQPPYAFLSFDRKLMLI